MPRHTPPARAVTFALAVGIIRTVNVRNSFVGIEHLTEDELEELRARCEQRAKEMREGDASSERRGLRELKVQAKHAAE